MEKVTARLIDGTVIDGQLTTNHPASSYGQKVFIDNDGQAYDWAIIASVDNNELDRDKLAEAIAWHLQNNFIPPQPPELLEYSLQALEACNSGDSERVISLPGGVNVTASELVSDLKLEDLLEA